VRRLPGQVAIGCARLLHWLVTLAITLALLTGAGVAALAWRLSEGPVDLPWLATRLEAAANANDGPTRLAIGTVALTWEGFRLGVDRPLDLRATNVTVTDRTGRQRLDIPRAEVSLSLRALLRGRIEPRAVEMDGPRLTIQRAADGALSLDLGSLMEASDSGITSPAEPTSATEAPINALLAELAQPAASDRDGNRNALLSQLGLLRIRDARVVVVDRQLGVTWRAPEANIDLTRKPQGGVNGTADLTLALGEQQARLTVAATLAEGATETHLRARLTPVKPAALAREAPSLAVLTAVDAPVSGEADLELDAKLTLLTARLTARAGPGNVRIGQASVPILEAALAVSGTRDALTLQIVQATLRGHEGGPQTQIQARGTAERASGRLDAALTLDLDQADFADLPRLWPQGIGGNARDWIVENIPLGMARNGHFEIALSAPEDLSSVALTGATGTLNGEGLQVWWLRPVPPIENGVAQLRVLDPDTLEIVVASGHERLRAQKPDSGNGGLQIRDGRVRITGIMDHHQVAAIDANIAGSVPDTIALLREPRLGLLDRHPIDLKNPAGQATVKLALSIPLERTVRMDDISVHVASHLEGVHLGGVVAGRDLDQGVLDLDASVDGLRVNGRALLAAIAAQIDAAMDFRAGPPAQVLQSVTVTGEPSASQLASAGLDATPVVTGPMQLQATLTERRNGQGELGITADLATAELTVSPLEWRKPRDVPAKASARLTLDRDRLTGIDAIQLDGEGVALRGSGDARDGKLALLHLDRMVLGRTVASGTVRLPDPAGAGPIVVDITGPTIDMAPRFSRRATTRKPSQPRLDAAPGPAWTVQARFDRAFMANDQVISKLALNAENDGRVFQRLRLEGLTGSRSSFLVQILPEKGGRRLTASAGDVGELLRGLDVVRTLQGGRLLAQATYDDAQAGRPLAGSAEIEGFRIQGAPALARLLQAMTLYGLVDVVQGPGLGFSRLIAPFRLTDDALELDDARAFSSSLGLTAKGRIDFAVQQLDMQGTIVPAYFFNSLLGKIPLVGKLFSPERGGGVFAASYTLRGPLDNPDVSVNPLTALTPGFLRGLFGMF
jgi:AsmA-like C-terminal region